MTAQVASIAACFPEQLLWIGRGTPPEASRRRAVASSEGSCGPHPNASSGTLRPGKKSADGRKMRVLSLVRGAGDGDLGVAGTQSIRREAQERERLQGLDAAAQRRLGVRRARGAQHLSRDINHGHVTSDPSLDDRSPPNRCEDGRRWIAHLAHFDGDKLVLVRSRGQPGKGARFTPGHRPYLCKAGEQRSRPTFTGLYGTSRSSPLRWCLSCSLPDRCRFRQRPCCATSLRYRSTLSSRTRQP